MNAQAFKELVNGIEEESRWMYKQWTYIRAKDGQLFGYNEKDGKYQFYGLITNPDYGQPLLHEEPTFGIPLFPEAQYRDPNGNPTMIPDGYLIGIVCINKESLFNQIFRTRGQKHNKVAHRMSLSNPQSEDLEICKNGFMLIERKTQVKWYLDLLYQENDKRFTENRFVGRYVQKPPKIIRIKEMENLLAIA